jgi:ferritin heavy chain
MGQDQGKLSIVRTNYNTESENGVNNVLNWLLNYVYECHAMILYNRRADVSLSGIALYYRLIASRLYGFTQKLMDYQTIRGGLVVLTDIKAPKFEVGAVNSSVDSFDLLLARLKHLNDEFCKLYAIADKHNDSHLQNFIQHELVHYTNEMIYFVGEKITKLKRVGTTGLGEYEFDKDLREWINENYVDEKTPEGFRVLKQITPVNLDASPELIQTMCAVAQKGVEDIINALGNLIITPEEEN